ncbi:hypothetical protein L1987_61275 [Smallanthus sonchifolius]|uniref:Uncharacterized protein n=1 Tax=Smallanthus sonchifolius TaxID=185202 RepID=A0ACB9DAJ6_9ASTR|nr:hypothetical protein L1987_61275 [Smallanthus sonchifolius]
MVTFIYHDHLGPSEVVRSIEEFQSVLKNDGDELRRWSELLEEPHSRGVVNDCESCFKDVGVTNGALASLYVGLTNFAGNTYPCAAIATSGIKPQASYQISQPRLF